MRYSFFPGCTNWTTAVEFGLSAEAVCKALEIELVELEDWSCCGASSAHSIDHELGLSLPARNVALAQDSGLDVVASCPACYQHVITADLKLREDDSWRQEMEALFEFSYTGQGHVRHLLEIVSDPEMLDKIRQRVTRPLAGLRVASYYGCVLVRPPEITGWDDPEHPERMDRVVEALGAEPVDWSYKVDCCGASMALSRADVVIALSSRLADAAREAGADVIACACGICQLNLDMRQSSKEKLPVLYFTELMGLAFGLPSAPKWLKRHGVNPRPVLEQKLLV